MAKNFIRKWGTKLIVPIFMVFYLTSFAYLENQVTYRFHVIHSSFDRMIPFCEYFIIPYFLWFAYCVVAILYFMFKNKDEKEYLQLIFNLGIGMTVFIIVSWLYPNGHFLRPMTFPRENIFTDMVRFLYTIDTSTNVLPSIHVYNTVAIFIAIAKCKALKNKHFVVGGSFALSVLIIASTMFLKQHTVIDVVCAFALNVVVYLLVYRPEDSRVVVRQRKYSEVENS
ncbi:phosphoesterase [Frisingicoccus sp.]|uniref:phosphoesterase n=1 Tax=Frisingicoccus sp. TaxID=1918627 RepID=UPI00305822D3